MPTTRRQVLEGTIALAVKTALGGSVAVTLASCGGSSSSTPAAPSSLSYTSPVTAIVGSAISNLSPTVNGSITSYSVSPALPAGLTLDTSTGVISGTPAAPAAQTTYTITASNSGGQASFALSLTVLGDLSITQVSSSAPTALTPVVLSMQGLDPSQPFDVKLTNGSDVNLTMQIVRTATDGSQIVIAAPMYIDPNTGLTSNLTGSVSVTQGSQTSNAVTLNISDIPSVSSYGVQPGEISRAFLNQLALGLAMNANALEAVQSLPSVTTDTTTVRGNLIMQQQAALEARDNIDLILSGSQPNLPVGTSSSGQPIQFNSHSIDAMDRVLAMYVQFLRLAPSPYYAPLGSAPPPSISAQARRTRRAAMPMPPLTGTRDGSASSTSAPPPLHIHAGGASTFKGLIDGMGVIGGELGVYTAGYTTAAAGPPTTTQQTVDQYISIGQGITSAALVIGTVAAAPELVAAGVIVGTLYGAAAMANDGYKWYTASQALNDAIDPATAAQAQQQLDDARSNFAVDTIGTGLGLLGFPDELAGDVGLGKDVVSALQANQSGAQGVVVQGLGLLTGATSLLIAQNGATAPADTDKQAVESADGQIPSGTDFGVIGGAVTVTNSANSDLVPLNGVQLTDPATGNTYQTSAGTDDNYQMIVPLGVPGMDYSGMQLAPYDPISDILLGNPITVNLSTLNSGTTQTEPGISGACVDTDASGPDQDDPDCDAQ
jgi:Putative Ig domain